MLLYAFVLKHWFVDLFDFQSLGTDTLKNHNKKALLERPVHMKTCSTSLIIREMPIKATMRNHSTPIRMAVIKTTENNNYWQDVETSELLGTAGGNGN